MGFSWSQFVRKRPVYAQFSEKSTGKRSRLILFAVVFGLAVTMLSTRVLLNLAASRQVLAPVVVPTHNIAPYSVITEKDVATKMVPLGGVGVRVVQNAKEIIGGITIAPLYKDEQIRQERVVPPGKVESDRCVVGVNVNLTRAAGGSIRPGDLVDVYWLYSDANPGGKIASDAQVLDIRDAQGNSLDEWGPSSETISKTLGAVSGTGKLPAVAVIAVKPEEVSRVVTGAHTKSEAIVLVKKLSPSKGATAYGDSAVDSNEGQEQQQEQSN